MDNSLLAVRDINHKYIVVVREKKVRFYGYKATNWGTTDYDKKIALERKNNQVFIGGLWLINL
jgi:hypothetical protein